MIIFSLILDLVFKVRVTRSLSLALIEAERKIEHEDT